MRTNSEKDRLETVEAGLRALFVRSLDGDAASYRSFLGALGGHLRAFFRKRAYRFPGEVEDLVQETLIAIHNQRHTYDPGQPLTAWAYAIARYKLVDALRRHGREDALHEPLGDSQEFATAADENAAESHLDIGRVLGLLPERQRQVVEFVKLRGLSVKETARLTGMSESAVKVTVHRALKTLAAKMREAP